MVSIQIQKVASQIQDTAHILRHKELSIMYEYSIYKSIQTRILLVYETFGDQKSSSKALSKIPQ